MVPVARSSCTCHSASEVLTAGVLHSRERPARKGSGRSNPGHTTVVPEIVTVGEVHASGHREVVQLGQGLRFHRPGRRLRRRLRPPLHHQDRRIPHPSGEPACRVHRWARPQGPAGGGSPPAVTRHATSRTGRPRKGPPRSLLSTGGRPPWHPPRYVLRPPAL